MADNRRVMEELLVALDPGPDSRLGHLLRSPLGDEMLFYTSGTWPRTKALCCDPVTSDERPAQPGVVAPMIADLQTLVGAGEQHPCRFSTGPTITLARVLPCGDCGTAVEDRLVTARGTRFRPAVAEGLAER